MRKPGRGRRFRPDELGDHRVEFGGIGSRMGGGSGGCGRDGHGVGVGKGNVAEAVEKSAEETAGGEIGDAAVGAGSAIDEALEDVVDFQGNLVRGHPLQIGPELPPASEVGIALVFWNGGRARPGRFGRVMAAEGLVAGSGAAAPAAAGQDEGALTSHGYFLRGEKKK